jgi:hypothetical protein
MFQALISTAVPPVTSLVLTETIIIYAMQEMLDERSRRNAAAGTNRFDKARPSQPMPASQMQGHAPPTQQSSKLGTNTTPPQGAANTNKQKDKHKPTESKPETDAEPGAEPEDPLDSIFNAQRDPGVSDEVWEQLERDKHAMVAKEREFRRLQEEKRQYEEMERQKKLKVMGPCPMGFRWVKQASGYRCAGGSHTLTEAGIDAYCR